MAKGWILVSEVESKRQALAVRVSAIDAIGQRTKYSTLYVHGVFIHVTETFEELTDMISKVETDD